ncbi:MAG: hypothetical protein WC650_00095 [Candidatus Doudnabacteria bacterium]
MTSEEFINKWRYSLNNSGLPAVGIHVDWDIIPVNSKVKSFSGKEAWEKIYNCTPPWFKTPQTFKGLVNTKNTDYLQIVREETENGKIEYYRQNGLQEPFFCAFANEQGSFILLGDGNHRFFNCVHLINNENRNFDKDLERTALDIIYLTNFVEIMGNIWKN